VRDERGFLVDLLALPDRLDVVAALVGAVIAELVRERCVEVLCWLPRRHPYRAKLHRAAFLNARELPIITFRPARIDPTELDFLTDPDLRLHYTLGDTDLV
jgi:hypothetical protein